MARTTRVTPERVLDVGDTVYLMSGSPRMTIVSVDDELKTVEVAWCVFGTGEPRRENYPMACVRYAGPPRPRIRTNDDDEDEDIPFGDGPITSFRR